MSEWEPWRDKLPKTVVERIDLFRKNRAAQKEVLSIKRLVTSPHITVDVPPGLMYKTVRIKMILEGE